MNLDLVRSDKIRRQTLAMNLAHHLIMNKWRDPDGNPRLNLYGQMKRVAAEWLDSCLQCDGGTYPAQLMYREIADMACERIIAAIIRDNLGERPILAVLDRYAPTGSSLDVDFRTAKPVYRTDARKCHVDHVVMDSGWEGEFARVVESHPRAIAYVKNQGMSFGVPYRYAAANRTYYPDFIIRIDDGNGADDPLNLVVETKGYRREDAKEKRNAMETLWIPGVNALRRHGRWAFAEFTDAFRMQDEFAELVDGVVGG